MKLTGKNVTAVMKSVNHFLNKIEVTQDDKKNLYEILNESLTRYKNYFGDDLDFLVNIREISAAPEVIIRIEGEQINLLNTETGGG